jgi:hypothetical protein
MYASPLALHTPIYDGQFDFVEPYFILPGAQMTASDLSVSVHWRPLPGVEQTRKVHTLSTELVTPRTRAV